MNTDDTLQNDADNNDTGELELDFNGQNEKQAASDDGGRLVSVGLMRGTFAPAQPLDSKTESDISPEDEQLMNRMRARPGSTAVAVKQGGSPSVEKSAAVNRSAESAYSLQRRKNGVDGEYEESLKEPAEPLEQRNPLFANGRRKVEELPPPLPEANLIIQEFQGRLPEKKDPTPVSEEKNSSNTFGQRIMQRGSQPSQKPQKLQKISLPTDVIHSPSATLGTLLAAARKEAGLTVEQVSAGTRISVNYVLALETGNHSQYPRRPFISGYVRSLCEIYRLKEDDSEFVLKKAREESLDAEQSQNPFAVAEVETPEESEEDAEAAKIRTAKYILWGKVGAAAVIIFSIVMFAFSLRSSGRNRNAENAPDAENTEPPVAVVRTGTPEKSVSPVPAKTEIPEKSTFNEELLRKLNAPRYPKASTVKVHYGRPKLED